MKQRGEGATKSVSLVLNAHESVTRHNIVNCHATRTRSRYFPTEGGLIDDTF